MSALTALFTRAIERRGSLFPQGSGIVVSASKAVFRAGLAGALAVVLPLAAGDRVSLMAHASSPEPPVIRLSCPAEPAELCRAAMRTLVVEARGNFDVRLVEALDVTPERDGDLGVTLSIDGQGPGWISAHFDWQAGPHGSQGRGPSIEMGVMDTSLSADMYTSFIQELIRMDAGLRALLTCES